MAFRCNFGVGVGFCLEVGVGSWNGEVLEDDPLCLMGRWLIIGGPREGSIEVVVTPVVGGELKL